MIGRFALAGLNIGGGAFCATALAVALTLATPVRAQEDAARCDIPAGLGDVEGRLVNAARALREGRKIMVLVVGSLSSTGEGLPGTSDAYPAQFETLMRSLLPGAQIEIKVVAKRDALASDQADAMADLVKRERAALVIWQTGSVEMVRRLDPVALGEALVKGNHAALGNKADLVLITPQFGGRASTLMDVKPYLVAMRQIAEYYEIPLFDRYEAMRHWVADGRLDPRANNRADVQKGGIFLHRCVGRMLARLVERLVRESSVYCPPSGGFADLGAALPRLSERLRKGQQIKIVAIGSSSTAGAGASNARNSYPARLASELRRLWPHIQLSVVNKGVNGDEAPQMMARFDADVRAENPDLVIWQVGTNAVITSNGVYRYEPTIQDGIHRLKAMGVDVIVMDPQYAPQVYTDPDYREMVRIIDRTARLEQVALFRRFHTTRYWVREQGIALADLVTADGLHHTDRGYACIAEALAQGIDAAARGAPLEQR